MGDSTPDVKCLACGVPWTEHRGIKWLCEEVQSTRVALRKLVDASANAMDAVQAQDSTLVVLPEVLALRLATKAARLVMCGFEDDQAP